ncbi:MAG: SHOCT domain-containing protein [Chloroflexi bacterium]|nr:MAG: SHOCT domain-containing protein [Chloroflexota bacterium]
MFMGFGLLIPLLVIGAIVYALGWRPQGQNTVFSPASSRSALDIAKERYARGEISKEEFEQIRQDLNS